LVWIVEADKYGGAATLCAGPAAAGNAVYNMTEKFCGKTDA